MAFGFKGAGSGGTSTTANQASLTVTTGTTAGAAGDLAVLRYGVDNNATGDGDEVAVTAVTDSAGNYWTKAVEFTNSLGTAQSGATVGIWYSNLHAALPIGGTVTLTFSNATSRDASVALIDYFTKASGFYAQLEGSNSPSTLANDAAAAGSLNLTTANIACLRIRATASESSTVTGWTKTAAFTATLQQAVTATGATALNIGLRGEYLISTATGQASAPTVGAGAVDNASVYVAFKEVAAPATGWHRTAQNVKAAAGVWPMLLLATQATQFAAPAPTAPPAPATDNLGWQIQQPKAPAVAKAQHTQATSFAVPPPADNNTTSKAWHQPLSKPVPVAKAQQGSTFVPFNTAQVVADTPRGWQRDLSTAPRRAVVANTSALTFVAAPFTVPRGWQGQPSVAPKLARVSASVLVGPLYPAAINNNTDAKGWYPPLAGAPKPAKANPTQATSFQTPEQSSVVDNNTEAKGWYPPLAGAPKTAQARQSQATSFQTPEQSAVPTPTPEQYGWFAALSKAAPVAKAKPGSSFVPLDTVQVAVGPTTQTVPLVQDASATYTFPVYYQARFGPPAYIAPDNNTTSKGWFRPLSVAVPVAKAQQGHTFVPFNTAQITPAPPNGWYAPLSVAVPVAQAKQGSAPTFVPTPFPQFSLAWQQPLSRAAPVAIAQQGWTFVPLNTAQIVAVPPQGWQQPLSKAVGVAKPQQGNAFVPLNTAQAVTPPTPIEGMAWHMPLGIVPARLLAAPQGWAFVPFDTVQVAPVVVEEVRRGGATYLTREEMRELARAQREIDKKKRRDDEAITETIREAYQDSVNPNLKIERQRAAEEDDDEEALIMLVMRHLLEDADDE